MSVDTHPLYNIFESLALSQAALFGAPAPATPFGAPAAAPIAFGAPGKSLRRFIGMKSS